MVSRPWLAPVAALLALWGCAPTETNVGSARLPDADSTIAAPAGPLFEVGKTKIPDKLSGPVRLAADRELLYSDVLAAAAAVKKAGGTPVLLVARRNKVEALPDPAPPDEEPAIKLAARIDGKACISPPDNPEATCVSREDQKRIDRAFVRQVLWQAVHEYGLKHVNVVVDPGIHWADAVRAIDGARTCCEKDHVVIHVEPTF